MRDFNSVQLNNFVTGFSRTFFDFVLLKPCFRTVCHPAKSVTDRATRCFPAGDRLQQFRSVMNWNSKQDDEPKRAWYPDLPVIPVIEQRWFTQEEMRQIGAAAEGQFKVLFYLAGSSGPRFGELAGLHVEDIDDVSGVIRVRHSVWRGIEASTKTKKEYRDVRTDSSTVVMLKQYLGDRSTGRVFQSKYGTPIDNHAASGELLKPLCKRLGIEPGGMHAFRHGKISQLQENNVSADLIKDQIGHSSLRTTRGYTHFTDE